MTAALDLYKRELLRWSEKINLIGPDVAANLDVHVAEALEAAKILEPRGEVLDFGSGGGLPAIPMAIAWPAARFHLVEVDQKKWAFLKRVVRECKLDAEVHGATLEEALERLPPGLRFSLVTSRAVGKPEQWLPLLADRMASEGRVALFQGGPETPEIPHFRKVSAQALSRGYLVTFHVKHR